MKYSVIYADPPWRYNTRANQDTKFGGGAMGSYETLSYVDLAELPMKNIMANNCVLFMWCTFPYLKQQIAVAEAWGFKYKTVAFTWMKTNKKDGKPFFGVGYYSKSNAEVCLLFTKGKIPPRSNSVSSAIIAPRLRHSAKPFEVLRRIHKMYGHHTVIELFARPSQESLTQADINMGDTVHETGLEVDGLYIQEFLERYNSEIECLESDGTGNIN